jgi:hypothetical protein
LQYCKANKEVVLERKPVALYCKKKTWQRRKAYEIGNEAIRLTTLPGGGHIADLRLLNGPDVSPLWVPPWATIEPYEYNEQFHEGIYGTTTEGKLLSGLVGHNICLDYFGSPSAEEAALGLSQHGEAPSSRWRAKNISVTNNTATLEMFVKLPVAGLDFTRRICLKKDEQVVFFTETVRNVRKADHFFHWTQHVTLGPPFLSPDAATVSIPGGRAITFPHGYDEGKALLASDREFDWPNAPLVEGGTADLTNPFSHDGLGFVVAVLLAKDRDIGFIAAVNKSLCLCLVYCFTRKDFPWVAVWEENQGITAMPWKQRTQARGLEFSTTPLPVHRRESFLSGKVLGEPTNTFIPALGTKTVRYAALLARVPQGFSQIDDVAVEDNKIKLIGQEGSQRTEIQASGICSHLA